MICEYHLCFFFLFIVVVPGTLTFIYRYPVKMLPGCHITLHTSARTDKDARLFLSALGIPFQGRLTY